MSKEVFIQVKRPMYIAGDPVKRDEVIQVSERLAKRLIGNGSAVEATPSEETAKAIENGDVTPGEVTEVEEAVSLASKTIAQLREIAKEEGVDIPDAVTKKNDIIELIIAATESE